MYDMMQNKLPAPYELNQFDGPHAMKRGGRAKSRGMTTVHMSPHEISIMEHIQGGNSRYNKHGVKEFHHLEELLKNPHILQSAHHHARAHHAEGGAANEETDHLRQQGRFGDTDVAAIGPHTQNFFNHLSGHPSVNPYTGHPEYFSIGNALGGVWNAVKGGAGMLKGGAYGGPSYISNKILPQITGLAKQALPHITGVAKQVLPSVLPMAQQALGNRYGDMGNIAGQALGHAATTALGPQQGPVNPYHQAVGQAIGQGVESYRGGASPRQAFGQGMQTAGSHLGGGMGSAMEGMGRSFGAGNNARNVLRSGANAGFDAMGGRQGLSDMAHNVAQGFGNGGMGGVRNAARQQFNDYRTRAMPQFHAPANMDQYPEGMGYAQYPE